MFVHSCVCVYLSAAFVCLFDFALLEDLSLVAFAAAKVGGPEKAVAAAALQQLLQQLQQQQQLLLLERPQGVEGGLGLGGEQLLQRLRRRTKAEINTKILQTKAKINKRYKQRQR